MKKYISVDREAIYRNAARGTNEPVLIVEYEDGRPPLYAHELVWDGPSRLVYRPDAAEGRLSSAWIETEAAVTVPACLRPGEVAHAV
jgi:hypothetical protein